MYYEEAVVKEYSRKDGRNNKQINLGVNSNYKKSDKVLIISSDKIETFKQNLEPKTKELEKELSVLQEENQKLKVDLEELKVEKEKIETLKNDIKETANKNVMDAKDKILEIQNQHADELKQKDLEIKKLNQLLQEENVKLVNEKDTSKTLLLALYSYEERGIINGFFNRTPPLVKQILKENPKPIETTKKE